MILRGKVNGSMTSAVIVRKLGAPAARATSFAPQMPVEYEPPSIESWKAGTVCSLLVSFFTADRLIDWAVMVEVRQASWKSIVNSN